AVSRRGRRADAARSPHGPVPGVLLVAYPPLFSRAQSRSVHHGRAHRSGVDVRGRRPPVGQRVRPRTARPQDRSLLHKAAPTVALTESMIREMTRLNDLYGAVNLSQGFPDFPAPEAIKDAACAAIRDDINQYAVTWGAPPLREAIAAQFARRYGVPVIADEQV